MATKCTCTKVGAGVTLARSSLAASRLRNEESRTCLVQRCNALCNALCNVLCNALCKEESRTCATERGRAPLEVCDRRYHRLAPYVGLGCDRA